MHAMQYNENNSICDVHIHIVSFPQLIYHYTYTYVHRFNRSMQWKSVWMICKSYAIPAPKIRENILEGKLWRIFVKPQNPQSIIV